MKNRIIITGIAGFIGSALADYLKEDVEVIFGGCDIIGIDRNPGLHVTHLQDINDKLPDIQDVYAVIHLAANPGVRDSHKNFENVVKDNILGTQKIIDKCITTWKPNKLLIASSSSIYGDSPIHEPSPKSPYAMSKLACENLLTSYNNCGMLAGINTCAMRIFTVYGPRQRKGLAIREFIDKILRDKTITVYGNGEQSRDFIYINDLCKGIKNLLERYAPPVIDMGTITSYSINQVIHLVTKLIGKEVRIIFEPSNRFDVKKTLSNNKCDDYMIPFEEGLKKQILWQKNEIKESQG